MPSKQNLYAPEAAPELRSLKSSNVVLKKEVKKREGGSRKVYSYKRATKEAQKNNAPSTNSAAPTPQKEKSRKVYSIKGTTKQIDDNSTLLKESSPAPRKDRSLTVSDAVVESQVVAAPVAKTTMKQPATESMKKKPSSAKLTSSRKIYSYRKASDTPKQPDVTPLEARDENTVKSVKKTEIVVRDAMEDPSPAKKTSPRKVYSFRKLSETPVESTGENTVKTEIVLKEAIDETETVEMAESEFNDSVHGEVPTKVFDGGVYVDDNDGQELFKCEGCVIL